MAGEISCMEVVELVTDLLEGVLPLERRAQVGEHLEECEGCLAYVEQMRATIRALRAAPLEELSAARRRELLRAFRGWAAALPG